MQRRNADDNPQVPQISQPISNFFKHINELLWSPVWKAGVACGFVGLAIKKIYSISTNSPEVLENAEKFIQQHRNSSDPILLDVLAVMEAGESNLKNYQDVLQISGVVFFGYLTIQLLYVYFRQGEHLLNIRPNALAEYFPWNSSVFIGITFFIGSIIHGAVCFSLFNGDDSITDTMCPSADNPLVKRASIPFIINAGLFLGSTSFYLGRLALDENTRNNAIAAFYSLEVSFSPRDQALANGRPAVNPVVLPPPRNQALAAGRDAANPVALLPPRNQALAAGRPAVNPVALLPPSRNQLLAQERAEGSSVAEDGVQSVAEDEVQLTIFPR